MRRGSVVLLLFVALTFPGQLLSHGGHVHKVMGTVSAVDTTHVEVETKDGELVSAELNEDTKYFKGDVPATLADLKIGLRAALRVRAEGENLIAREVRLPSEKQSDPEALCPPGEKI